MPAPTTTNAKTVTKDLAPHLTAAHLTTLLATPVELLTIAQVRELLDAIHRTPAGTDPHTTIGAALL